jgi:hypothetical protein
MKINELYETVINYQTDNKVFFQNAENWDIRRLHEMYKEGELILQDWFQRDYCWDKSQVCSLIHTLLNTPTLLPEIVLIKIEDKYYVADGHQRLRSILIEVLDNPNFKYISKELTESTKYYKISPKKEQLWKEFSREIERKTITVKIIVNMKLDEEELRNLKSYVFKKWNNGTALSEAEKRGAFPSDLNINVVQRLKNTIPLEKQMALLVSKLIGKNAFNQFIEILFYHYMNPNMLRDPESKRGGGYDIVHSYSEDEYNGKFKNFTKLFMVMADTVYNFTQFNGSFGPKVCCMRDVLTFVNDLYIKGEIKNLDDYSSYLLSVLDTIHTTYYNNNEFKDYRNNNLDAIDMEINATWFQGFFRYFGQGQNNNFEQRRMFLYDNRELFGNLIDYDKQRLFSETQKQIKYIEQNRMCAGLDGSICQYHGTESISITEMEADHIVEHSNGGRTTDGNCQMLCIECHAEKTKRFNTKEVVL